MSTASPSSEPGWREQKKARTRQLLQEQALRLFQEKGFEATTVEEIAAAAGVSHMTFFRYFPAKEDVVDYDDYSPTLAEHIAGRPSDEPPLEMIRHALAQGQADIEPGEREVMLARMRLVLSTPALQARAWAHKTADELLIARALAAHPGRDADALETQVIAAAAVAAVTAAIRAWTEADGKAELPALIDQAFRTLTGPARRLHSAAATLRVPKKERPSPPHPDRLDRGFQGSSMAISAPVRSLPGPLRTDAS